MARLGAWDGTAPKIHAADVNWLGDTFPEMFLLDNVAVMECHGVVALRPNNIERNLGMLDYGTISGWCASAKARGVLGVVLFADSPGGGVTGMIETSEVIAALAAEIPVCVFVDSLCCSAMYSMAAPAGRIFCTKSAALASVGTKVVIPDASKLYESMGVKFHSITSGKYKNAGDMTQAMSDDHLAYFQGLISKSADEFKSWVAQNRPGIDQELFDGRIVHGTEAVATGFADEILTGGLEEAIARVASGRVPLRQSSGRSSFVSKAGASATLTQRQGPAAEAEAAFERAASEGRAKIVARAPHQRFTAADFRKTN